jgi:hypothetical protein
LRGFAVTCFEADGIVVSPGVNVAVLVDDFGVGHVGIWTSLALFWLLEGSSAAIFVSWGGCWHVLSVRIVPVLVGQDGAWRVATTIRVSLGWVFGSETDVTNAVNILRWAKRLLKTFTVRLIDLSGCSTFELHIVWESPSVNCGSIIPIVAIRGAESCLELGINWW